MYCIRIENGSETISTQPMSLKKTWQYLSQKFKCTSRPKYDIFFYDKNSKKFRSLGDIINHGIENFRININKCIKTNKHRFYYEIKLYIVRDRTKTHDKINSMYPKYFMNHDTNRSTRFLTTESDSICNMKAEQTNQDELDNLSGNLSFIRNLYPMH